MGGKQADRNAKKKAAKEEDTADAVAAPTRSFTDMIKVLFLGSTIMQVFPGLQGIMTDDSKAKAPEKEKEEEKEKVEGEEEAPKPTELTYADQVFDFLKNRLVWFNCLGLAEPATPEEAMTAWLELKDLEIDYGPRPKRNQSPGLDRIKVNVQNNFPQYLHVLLALMMLRAFLFRSWFACLPWLVGYQYLSLWVPLDGIPQLPQVPVEKCPLKFRVAASVGIHLLVWLFFVYEALWKMWFFEKFLVLGLIAYHAYAVRPADKSKTN
eukprot:gnl/MRDRNA2_/MRDRNA2_34655_c0_seq1.p1 gnl/MRDRNA2_/MRDRNA2_34655_c0~~gnl/MRDRNA2_/MRDRNA2_34655_c0_seq1.p1  ORF type:complete len:291 (-),score=63.73 gnl/MRDRNA2_/MRDRNA2_34655_c0_seq1:224-1021(-)